MIPRKRPLERLVLGVERKSPLARSDPNEPLVSHRADFWKPLFPSTPEGFNSLFFLELFITPDHSVPPNRPSADSFVALSQQFVNK
jgi:hypothetical protein